MRLNKFPLFIRQVNNNIIITTEELKNLQSI
jgi:hypothetical protein